MVGSSTQARSAHERVGAAVVGAILGLVWHVELRSYKKGCGALTERTVEGDDRRQD